MKKQKHIKINPANAYNEYTKSVKSPLSFLTPPSLERGRVAPPPVYKINLGKFAVC